MRLGFLGTGIMGGQMVLRLLEKDWKVSIWNREAEAIPPLVAAGALSCRSPAEVASQCDVLLLCVLDRLAVESCIHGESGALRSGRIPELIIDFSTNSPDAAKAFAAEVSPSQWIDSPVSGGPAAAREGKLTAMIGAAPDAFAKALPILESLASKTTLMGPIGAGQATKLVNQTIVCANYVLLAEALALAETLGLNAECIPACLAGGLADSELLRRVYPQMQQRDFMPPRNFARQVLKDLYLIEECSAELALTLPLLKTARQTFDQYVKGGNELRDSASIIDHYRQTSS